MYTRSETFFNGHDQTKLFLQTWFHPKAKGTILFTHGQAEHSDCYFRLIEGLEQIQNKNDADNYWNFIGWDMRGHGRSEGLRGYAKDFDDYVLDYNLFIEISVKILSQKYNDTQKNPLVLLGHSMGGLVQTCSLVEKHHHHHYSQIKGQILSSPLFGVSTPVPAWKDAGADFLAKTFPKVTLGNEIRNEMLTRDLDVIRDFEKDTYRHNKISAGVYLGFKREFPKVFIRASEVDLPTLLHISDSDPVVSSSEALKFFDLLPTMTKSLKIVEGGKHELYNDTCRNDIYQTVNDFLLQILNS